MRPCPNCGSTSPRRLQNEVTAACLNTKGCDERRCYRRKAEDRKRFKGKHREQCHGTTGQRSVLFCELGVDHEGLHLHGTREWGGDYEAPVAKALRAGVLGPDSGLRRLRLT